MQHLIAIAALAFPLGESPAGFIPQVYRHRQIKVINLPFNHVYLKAVSLAFELHDRSALTNRTDAAGLLGVPVKYLTWAQRNNKHV